MWDTDLVSRPLHLNTSIAPRVLPAYMISFRLPGPRVGPVSPWIRGPVGPWVAVPWVCRDPCGRQPDWWVWWGQGLTPGHHGSCRLRPRLGPPTLFPHAGPGVTGGGVAGCCLVISPVSRIRGGQVAATATTPLQQGPLPWLPIRQQRRHHQRQHCSCSSSTTVAQSKSKSFKACVVC